MISEKEMRSAAKEVVTVLGLVDENKEDIVITKATTLKELKKIIDDVINEKLITKDDTLSDETQAVIDAMTSKPGKKNAKPGPEPEEEEDDEDDDPDDEDDDPDDEGEHAKKIANKLHKELADKKINTTKGMDVPTEDDEDDVEKVKKTSPAKKGKKIEKKKGVTRAICICRAMQSVPSKGKTIDEVAAIADKEYVKAGGTSNVTQTVHHIKVFIPAGLECGIFTVEGDKVFPVS